MTPFRHTALLSILLTALAAHPVAAEFEAGIAAYQANDLPLAYKEFVQSAEEGHTDSMYNVALMYEQGIGVKKDEAKALTWYEKAAQKGHAPAQFNLGVLYENGRGTEVDFAKANTWYRKASVQGDPLAIGNLGMLYIRGDGVKEDKIAGIALLLISATLDNSPANSAKQNIAGTRGLTPDMIAEAQALSEAMSDPKSMLTPLDAHLKKSTPADKEATK